MNALEHAELCIAFLKRALKHAEAANTAWQQATGPTYNTLVKSHEIDTLVRSSMHWAAQNVICLVRQERFPALPINIDKWAGEAVEANVPLAELAEWFADQVGPDADEKTWAHLLMGARQSLYRVGTWNDNRHEAQLSGCRLSLQIHLWRKWSGHEWHNDSYAGSNQLRGLETVISRTDNPNAPLKPTGILLKVALCQSEPCRSFTGWHLAPYIRTYKNGRFDIWLRDEVLAVKIKAVLENN